MQNYISELPTEMLLIEKSRTRNRNCAAPPARLLLQLGSLGVTSQARPTPKHPEKSAPLGCSHQAALICLQLFWSCLPLSVLQSVLCSTCDGLGRQRRRGSDGATFPLLRPGPAQPGSRSSAGTGRDLLRAHQACSAPASHFVASPLGPSSSGLRACLSTFRRLLSVSTHIYPLPFSFLVGWGAG